MTEKSSFDWSVGSLWHSSAPEAVRRSSRAGKDADAWVAWQQYLRQRTEPSPFSELLPGKFSPLVWALPDGLENGAMPPWVTRLTDLGAGRRVDRPALAAALAAWQAAPADGQLDADFALEALAWGHALPSLAAFVEREEWLGLVGRLLSLASEAQSLLPGNDPLAQQLLAGELGLTLAYLLPEINACRQAAKPSKAVLAAGLGGLLDSQGLPHGRHLGQVRALLACWTRARAILDAMSAGRWNAKTETQYQRFVRQSLRLTRPDGTHALARPTDRKAASATADKELLAAVSESMDGDSHLAAMVLDGAKRPAPRAKKQVLPGAGSHSEQACLAVLRRGWDKQAPRLVVDFHGKSVQLEFCCGPDVFWSGDWELDVQQDGQRLEKVSDWSEVCWYSDEQIDYLEVEATFTGGLRVQRHIALAYEDGFLLMADSVLGGRPSSLEYRCRLPIGERVRFEPANESHEGLLVAAKRRALVLPLALPEWRCDGRPDSLAATERSLELHQSATATAMFTPLFVDFDPRRIRRPFTWRQLTVAENLQILPNDIAVGYRVMVGDQQWLLYRSLAAVGNRTLLGHNLISQMLIAQFGRDGEVESLVEIE